MSHPRLIFAVLAILKIPSVAFAAELPQDHDWQIALRGHLATLKTADFAIDDHTFTYPEAYEEQDDERVYRDWIVLGHLGREPPIAALQAAPEYFTLARIQGDDAIRIFPEPGSPAWWAQFDFPGNPYAASQRALRRALVMAAVDMTMLESAQQADPRNLKPDFMAANLGQWAYTLHHAAHLLPTAAEQAYRAGMLHYLEKMERLAPRDENTNMDMREIVKLAELDLVFEDEAMHRRLVREARRILFGDPERTPATSDGRRGTFHPAGYIGEADGPETSYNGISLYHLAEAAMITHGDADWDAFLPEVVERMVRFKAYNTFPEPDGSYEGPSSWAKRTNDPYPHDQRDRPWRPFAEAMLTEEGLYRLRVHPGAYDGHAWGLASREAMLSDIRAGIQRLRRRPSRPEKWSAEQPPIWQEGHWPADLPYTWDHYLRGSYARFQKLAEEQSDMLLPPFERGGDFSINFDKEFWAVKRGDWGFQVEAVPHMGRGYEVGGSGALAGGSLAAFWTRPTGVVVLGRLPDKWNYVTWDKVDGWPTHHLWGRTAGGVAFSSARQREPWVRYETGAEPPHIHVLGSLGTDRTIAEAGALDAGHVYYRRRFTLEDDGLRIESELLSQGADEVTELWETLPIYLNDARQRKGTDTAIEFRIGETWRPGGISLADEVEAIRAFRYDGSVQIEFDQPQRVRLSDVIVTRYQKKDRLQNIQIDLLGNGGRPTAMPRRAAVSYVVNVGHSLRE
ncbi:MAG: hypothetical protein KY475_12465 [Planctomycetes bacterium]|nr:hypothetical protein [Planctomycetota bacterium]